MEENTITPSPLPNSHFESSFSPSRKVFLMIGGVFLGILILSGIFGYVWMYHNNKVKASQKTEKTVSPKDSTNAEIAGFLKLFPTDEVGQTASNTANTDVIDSTKLPLGDGKVATTPQVGYVYSCQQQFEGGGAQHVGTWIHGDTWNLAEKLSVQGAVSWPKAVFSLTMNGTNRVITGNGLPVDTKTGTFPIQKTDPAYEIDKNPNPITEQTISFSIPVEPIFAKSETCVPMGMVGVALNGVAIYNALDAQGRDAVAHEVQDLCDGHPQGQGEYHYHGPSRCLPNQSARSTLIGYALDGFGIYSMYDAQGKELTNADLDACHGTTSSVYWNGKETTIYHYVLTREYPYTIGCFKGTVANSAMQKQGVPSAGQRPPPPGTNGPAAGQKPPHQL